MTLYSTFKELNGTTPSKMTISASLRQSQNGKDHLDEPILRTLPDRIAVLKLLGVSVPKNNLHTIDRVRSVPKKGA